MSLAAIPNFATFNGSGSAGPFFFLFPFYDDSEISVVTTDPAGDVTTLVQNTEYTVAGAGTKTGGSIQLTGVLLSGWTLTATRTVPMEQDVSFLPAYIPGVIESAFDYQMMVSQQLESQILTGIPGVKGNTGSPGASGSTWYHQAGVPSNTIGINGDYDINTTNYDILQKQTGIWVVVGNIKGTGVAGPGSSTDGYIALFSGAGGATIKQAPIGITPIYDNGSLSGSQVINWNNGSKQKITLAGAGMTLNFTDLSIVVAVSGLILKITQGSGGSKTVTTWDTDIKWAGGAAPFLSTVAGSIDIISFFWDGANYFGSCITAFA